jgi:hypothetical protein
MICAKNVLMSTSNSERPSAAARAIGASMKLKTCVIEGIVRRVCMGLFIGYAAHASGAKMRDCAKKWTTGTIGTTNRDRRRGKILYEINAQRAKQTPERSRALPQWQYRNPELNASFKKRDKGEAMDKFKLSDKDSAALKDCLELWARFMDRPDVAIGWRGKTVLLESEASLDSQQLYDRADNKAAEAINGCVDSLPRHLAWAIGKGCGINNVWRYPNINYLDALVEARFELVKRLRLNHETRSFFG